jgi:hypothetical protein
MNPPIILDIEASGFGKNSYPIEVGFIDESLNTWCALIKPEEDWQHWDFEAENMHDISRDCLLKHGKSAKLVAEALNQKLQNKTVYSDGWMHDFTWISLLFDSAKIQQRFKLEDLRHVLTPKQEAIWHTTKKLVQQELNTKRHRASVDAKVLQLTWQRTRETI